MTELDYETQFLRELRERAAARRKRIGFPEAWEERTRVAIEVMTRDALVDVVAIGETGHMEAWFGDAEAVERVDPARHPAGGEAVSDPLAFAARLLARGELDGVVAGAALPTADVIRAGLAHVGLAPSTSTVSSAFYMVLRRPTALGTEVLTFTDPAVVPHPSAEQLAESADAACRARVRIVGDEPRVAFLSYSTHGSAEGRTVEKMREALRHFTRRCPDVSACGELQVDAALVPEVAARKAPESVVQGQANILVFPNLASGNIAYKLVERLAEAHAIGPILQGLAAPLNDLSRGASVQDIVHVACITSLSSNASADRAGAGDEAAGGDRTARGA